MASVEEILEALTGRISDSLLENIKSELTEEEPPEKSAKRQRIYEYLDDQSDVEPIVTDYLQLKDEQRQKAEEEAANTIWRNETWARIQDILAHLTSLYHAKLGKSRLYAEIWKTYEQLIYTWNTLTGPKCKDCGRIQEICHYSGSFECLFKQHVEDPDYEFCDFETGSYIPE